MAGDERGGHGAAHDDYGAPDGGDGEAVHPSGAGVFERGREDDGERGAFDRPCPGKGLVKGLRRRIVRGRSHERNLFLFCWFSIGYLYAIFSLLAISATVHKESSLCRVLVATGLELL